MTKYTASHIRLISSLRIVSLSLYFVAVQTTSTNRKVAENCQLRANFVLNYRIITVSIPPPKEHVNRSGQTNSDINGQMVNIEFDSGATAVIDHECLHQ